MHEYSLVQELVGRVEAEMRGRGATAVHRVSIRVGDLSGVDRGLLATAFDTFKPGTVCEQAELQLTRVEPRWACSGCKQDFAAGARLQCEACGAPAKLVQGDEILLDQLDLEVP